MQRPLPQPRIPTPVLIVSAAVAVSLFGDSMLYAVMPASPERWGLSVGLVGVLLSANRLVRLATNPLAAYLFERFGRQAPFAAALLLSVLTTLTYGWVTAFALLLAARMLWGFAWSILRLGGYWTVLDEARDTNRGLLMGVYGAIARSGSLVGVVAGAVLADSIGHDWTLTIFAVATALGAIAWFASTQGGRAASPAGQRARPDAKGGLGAVLRDPQLLSIGASGLSSALVFSGLLTASLGFYLRERYGDEVALAGLAISVASFTGIALGLRFVLDFLLAPLAGYLSDRAGRPPLTLTAFGAGLLGLVALATAPPLGVVLVALGIGFAASTTLTVLLEARAGDLAPPERRSAVMSTYATFHDLGAALGPLVGLSVGTLGALRWGYAGGAVLLAVMALWYRAALRRRGPTPAPTVAAPGADGPFLRD